MTGRRIVVTGGDGFVGRNLRVRLQELGYADVVSVTRSTSLEELRAALATADFVFHLAGVNRPTDPTEFETGNRGVTATICELLRESGRATPVAYSSSIQAAQDNPYGRSKRAAEVELERYAASTGAAVYLYRLCNVFGKWARPNYNSAVATFCHNIARGLPITVNDRAAEVRLVYVDDVVAAFVALLREPAVPAGNVTAEPVYTVTLGDLSDMLYAFAESRRTLLTPPVGSGFPRALWATYVSYLPPAAFDYPLVRHADPRGVFAEMLRTPDSGQLSFFTAHPGITRGGHYHHSKTEKFLVVQGRARFGFRHIVTGEVHEIHVSGEESRVVETVPGWAHDVTNVGNDEMIVMLWANEIFDPAAPDTVAAPVVA